jgi:Ras-related protein Rab-32
MEFEDDLSPPIGVGHQSLFSIFVYLAPPFLIRCLFASFPQALASGGGGAGAMVPGGGGKREHLYKILVIGELGTGKTSIIKRYVHQFFSQHYRATIGVDFALKVINWDADTIIRLQLWDIAGECRPKSCFGNFKYLVLMVPSKHTLIPW